LTVLQGSIATSAADDRHIRNDRNNNNAGALWARVVVVHVSLVLFVFIVLPLVAGP